MSWATDNLGMLIIIVLTILAVIMVILQQTGTIDRVFDKIVEVLSLS